MLSSPRTPSGRSYKSGLAIIWHWSRRNELATLAQRHGVPLYGAGRVTAPGTPLAVRLQRGTLRWDVAELRRTYFDAIPRRMRAVATSTGEGA